MRILVTGGAGYIGSHICVSALQAGHEVTIFDNFANSDVSVPARIERTAGRRCQVIQGDVRDEIQVHSALEMSRPEVVMHLAGLKSVADSVERPLDYFDTNVAGTACLLRAIKGFDVRRLVFSSSATVYGEPIELPIRETHPLNPASPYGRSKLMAEWLCADYHKAASSTAMTILRYFNPVGAYPGGAIGDDPHGKPNNLMPCIAQVACGRRPLLEVFGDDYLTEDGTGVRDYIHVCDLAEGHLAAISPYAPNGHTILNLGTGIGISVLEMVRMIEAITERGIPLKFAPRRSGDVAKYYADPSRANDLLNWRATRGLEDMCRDALSWQKEPESRRLHV